MVELFPDSHPAKEVDSAHAHSDVDSSVFAQHHTLGTKAGQAAPGNHKHGIGGGGFTAAGPWGTPPPPNSVSGLAFTVDVAGTYRLELQASSFFNVGTGAATYTAYVDGNNMASRGFFFNVASTHMTGPRLVWSQYLTVGTHYIYLQCSVASDANDTLSFTWSKISDSGLLVPPVQTTYDTGWIEVLGGVGFQNGWVNYDSRTVRYRKVNGIVYTEGICKNGTVGTTIFTYPPGFRCSNRNLYDKNLVVNRGGTPNGLNINGDGRVVDGATTATGYIDLSGIPPFIAEN